ncbi:MAG TPA: hypothetical protein VMX15_06725 [Candidatus Heimdallarchaeota archaeon]|nr:hypothetical protein [Candidatus Heimdallarchaeota archaeon]
MPEVRNINLMIADGDRIDDSIAVMVKAIDRELLTVRDIMLLVDIKSILRGIKKAWDAGKCV